MVTALGLDASWTGFGAVAFSITDDGEETVEFKRFSSSGKVAKKKSGKKKSSKRRKKGEQTPEIVESSTDEKVDEIDDTVDERIPQPERMDRLVTAVFEWIARFPAIKSTAIEGYSFGSENGREMAGELGGFVRWRLWSAGMSYRVVQPPSLKMFLTGKGNGKKDEMMMHTFKRWGFEAPNNDVCDAYILARLAHAALQPTHTKAFEKLLSKTTLVPGRAISR